MLHKVTSSIYQTLFIFILLSDGIATIMALPLLPVSWSALQLERRVDREKNSALHFKIGRIVPDSDGKTCTWILSSSPSRLFGEESLAFCIGGKDCFAVWPTTKAALLPLSAFKVNVPIYPSGWINYDKLSSLGGKVYFKSSYPKYNHLPEKSTTLELLEDINEIAKQTKFSITDDISYVSASLALLKNKGVLDDPDQMQKDWDEYKGQVEQDRKKQHEKGQHEKEQHEKEQHEKEQHEKEQEAKAARQGNMGLNFILHP
ncbi:hypothetical protein F5879DRAFT_990459 [Lentinula edodes]|nr:hypothetical protein F5879DRAFT_990459 [Lentinula edodes]KAJ3917447.1 hypothetical protein F5877DRAFT_79934 [Lentinula edodes]